MFLSISKEICLNEVFHRADGPANWANARLVRYADDFVVLARYQSDRLNGWIEAKLEIRMDLEVNREKTQVVNLREVGQSLPPEPKELGSRQPSRPQAKPKVAAACRLRS